MSKSYALGYEGSGGLLVLQHTVPNNLPMILWQDRCRQIPDWQAFFPSRRMPTDLQSELDEYRPPLDGQAIASALQQRRLARSISNHDSSSARLIALTLAASNRRIYDRERLAALMGVSLSSAEALLDACRRLQLIDTVGRLTDEGRWELRRARTRPAIEPRTLCARDAIYYPSQLRGV
jgi:hypothetical protein